MNCKTKEHELGIYIDLISNYIQCSVLMFNNNEEVLKCAHCRVQIMKEKNALDINQFVFFNSDQTGESRQLGMTRGIFFIECLNSQSVHSTRFQIVESMMITISCSVDENSISF